MRKLELTPWKAEQPPKAWSYTKRCTIRLKHTRNMFRKDLQLKGAC